MKLIHDVLDLGAASIETHGPEIGAGDDFLGRPVTALSND